MKKSILIECLKAIPGDPEIAICDQNKNRVSNKTSFSFNKLYKHFDVEYLEAKSTHDNKPLALLSLTLNKK